MTKKEPTRAQVRIAHARATMPYGALIHEPRAVDMTNIDLEYVADYLEALREIVKQYSDDVQTTTLKYDTLKRDVEGLRRLFGTGT